MQAVLKTNIKFVGVALAAAVILAGCEPTPDEIVTNASGETVTSSGLEERLPDTCMLSNYEGFVGQPVTAVAIPADVKTRIVRPADILSQVYESARVNFYVNESGVITRVICG